MAHEPNQEWSFNPYVWGIAVITSHVLMFLLGFIPLFFLAPPGGLFFALAVTLGGGLAFLNYFLTARLTAAPIYFAYLGIHRRWPW